MEIHTTPSFCGRNVTVPAASEKVLLNKLLHKTSIWHLCMIIKEQMDDAQKVLWKLLTVPNFFFHTKNAYILTEEAYEGFLGGTGLSIPTCFCPALCTSQLTYIKMTILRILYDHIS